MSLLSKQKHFLTSLWQLEDSQFDLETDLSAVKSQIQTAGCNNRSAGFVERTCELLCHLSYSPSSPSPPSAGFFCPVIHIFPTLPEFLPVLFAHHRHTSFFCHNSTFIVLKKVSFTVNQSTRGFLYRHHTVTPGFTAIWKRMTNIFHWSEK